MPKPGDDGTKDGDDNLDNKDAVTKESFKEMQDSVKLLAESGTASQKTIDNLTKQLGELNTVISKSLEPDPPDDPDKYVSPDDKALEVMTRAEYATHIQKSIMSEMKGLMKGLNTKVEDSDAKAFEKELRVQVKEAQKVHPDFDKWKPEMHKVFKENPYISMEDAYTLVRAKDSTKAGEMDKEFKLKNGKPLESGKLNGGDDTEKEEPFFGLTPTSGKTVKNQKMSKTDAANSAWESVMGESGIT